MKILIVEDDDRLLTPLREYFEQQGAAVEIATDGVRGLELARENQFDLILLDVMLPGINGSTICKTLREEGCQSAIIIITARSSVPSKIENLNYGADDYLGKPFSLAELSAHVNAVMRRYQSAVSPDLTISGIRWNSNMHEVKYRDAVLPMTPTEYRLFTYFLANPDRTITNEELLNSVWKEDKIVGLSVIKTNIKTIRKKVKDAGAVKELIENVYGIGYRFRSK